MSHASSVAATALVVPFEQLRMTDVESVGGKNASLGEMISQLAATGVRVPGGFATTAHAFRLFLKHNGLAERICQFAFNHHYFNRLSYHRGILCWSLDFRHTISGTLAPESGQLLFVV